MAKTQMNFRLDTEVIQKLDEAVEHLNSDESLFHTFTRTDLIQLAILDMHKRLSALKNEGGEQ